MEATGKINTIEGNKMIAEFLGAAIIAEGISENLYEYDGGNIGGFYFMDHPSAMKFHTKWDWLMPVVEEIEKKTGKRLQIMGNFCYAPGVFIAKGEELRVYGSTKIEAVYLAVLQFITWHNSKHGSSGKTKI